MGHVHGRVRPCSPPCTSRVHVVCTAVHTALYGQCTRPRRRAVRTAMSTAVYGPYARVHNCVYGRVHECTCRRQCTRPWTWPVHGHVRVYVRGRPVSTAVYGQCTSCIRPCTRSIHGRVYGLCIRPCTRVVALYRPCLAVYMVRDYVEGITY